MPDHPTSSSAAPDAPPNDTSTFRRTFVRVMSVQVVALLALWLLQARYSR